MESVRDLDVHEVIALVNEYSTDTRFAADEASSGYPEPAIFGPGNTVAGLIEIADELVAAIRDLSTRIDRLNHLIERNRLEFRLEESGTLSWHQPTPTLAGAAVASLLYFIADHGVDRIGVCRATRCVDIYIDRSHNGRRTFCSEKCSARTRVAAWRARNNLSTK